MRPSTGLTLLELLLVIAIAGTLASMAVPSFKPFMARRAAQAAADTLLTDVRYARAEAIKRAHSVTICRSDNGTACAAGKGSWHGGWIVFDESSTGANSSRGTVDPGEAILRVQSALPGVVAIAAGSGASNTDRFYTFGLTGTASGASSNLWITADAGVSGGKRLLCVSFPGRFALRPVGTEACA